MREREREGEEGEGRGRRGRGRASGSENSAQAVSERVRKARSEIREDFRSCSDVLDKLSPIV